MDKILHLTLLYDFYGELLTGKQKDMFEMYHLNDLSMQEIAEQFDISRQAVNDLLKRTEKILIDYESKLSLVHDYILNKEKIKMIIRHIDVIINCKDNPYNGLCEIRRELLEING